MASEAYVMDWIAWKAHVKQVIVNVDIVRLRCFNP